MIGKYRFSHLGFNFIYDEQNTQNHPSDLL